MNVIPLSRAVELSVGRDFDRLTEKLAAIKFNAKGNDLADNRAAAIEFAKACADSFIEVAGTIAYLEGLTEPNAIDRRFVTDALHDAMADLIGAE